MHPVFSQGFVGSSSAPPRATILVPKVIATDCILLREWCSRDIVTVRATSLLHSGAVILTSHYMDGTLSSPVSEELRLLIAHCNAEKSPLIIGSDTNSHSTAWGARDCNPRGLELEAFCASNGLSWANIGNKTTFVTRSASSHIDLTFYNQAAANFISG